MKYNRQTWIEDWKVNNLQRKDNEIELDFLYKTRNTLRELHIKSRSDPLRAHLLLVIDILNKDIEDLINLLEKE